jgi:lipopolysaccharide transport system ATP-binding protein
MSDTVIRVENLGKKYIIGHQKQERYTSLRDVITDKVRSFGKVLSRKDQQEDPTHEEFWALKDVSFEVKQGDRVGIIGRNGAGKSTLLKILSRITEPTEGRISINGRVASLLEVGTGFHPELTGRENIFLNGAILGMDRVDIKRKFDEIVAFAEVEKFLDTPVKRYSSGMYVRLAFAVAAHLEPEILIVDEVLAVGDAQFQKKCLGKMKDVSGEGRTVLFVSHSMPTITSLCEKVILLDAGRVIEYGRASEVISRYYFNLESSKHHIDFSKVETVVGDTYANLISASIVDQNGSSRSEFLITEEVKLKMRFKILSNSSIAPLPTFDFRTSEGIYAFGGYPMNRIYPLEKGEYEYECIIPSDFLNEGVYLVTVNLHSFSPTSVLHFNEKDILAFTIKDPIIGTRNYDYTGPIAGVVRPKLAGDVVKLS